MDLMKEVGWGWLDIGLLDFCDVFVFSISQPSLRIWFLAPYQTSMTSKLFRFGRVGGGGEIDTRPWMFNQGKGRRVGAEETLEPGSQLLEEHFQGSEGECEKALLPGGPGPAEMKFPGPWSLKCCQDARVQQFESNKALIQSHKWRQLRGSKGW